MPGELSRDLCFTVLMAPFKADKNAPRDEMSYLCYPGPNLVDEGRKSKKPGFLLHSHTLGKQLTSVFPPKKSR